MFEWKHTQTHVLVARIVVAIVGALMLVTAAAVVGAGPAWAINHCSTQIKAKKTANASRQIYLPSGQPTCSSAAVTAVFVVNNYPTTTTSNFSGMAPNSYKTVTYAGAADTTTVRGCSVNAPVSCTWSSSYSGTSWWTHN